MVNAVVLWNTRHLDAVLAEIRTSGGLAQPETGPLFRGWGKPAVALVFTGQQYGYLQPCGCSSPQLGGLTRRLDIIGVPLSSL